MKFLTMKLKIELPPEKIIKETKKYAFRKS